MGLSPAVGGAILLVLLGWAVVHRGAKERAFQAIPSVVSAPFGLSFIAFLKFLKDGRTPLLVGYKKHKGGSFRIPEGVVVTGPKLVEELRQCPDDVMSFEQAVDEDVAATYTLGWNVVHAGYHNDVVRFELTRKLPTLIPDLVDENQEVFNRLLGNNGNEWFSVHVFDMAQRAIAQIANRVFIGLPICRNESYLNMMIGFTMHVVTSSFMVKLFPRFMWPHVGVLVEHLRTNPALRRAEKYLGPLIQERLDKIADHGKDYADKPNDYTSWLLDNAEPQFANVEDLTRRILAVNFAAIHTSSTSFTQVLCNLAKYPQYYQPLREELEEIVDREGWTKSSLQKMQKLDSFMKETSRLEGIGDLSIPRAAMRDFTFSDGTFIPKGTRVWAASGGAHRDNENYEDAEHFDGFRFANMREVGSGTSSSLRHHMVTTGPTYLAFGHGRHACPGRFFAVTELKIMVAHIILHYDISLKDGVVPESSMVGSSVIADMKAHLLFRKRRV